MNTFGDDLSQSLNEALAHAKGEGPALVHVPVAPREVRKQAKLTQAQMAPLMGMSLSGYRKWEQGTRRVSGPARPPTLLPLSERYSDQPDRSYNIRRLVTNRKNAKVFFKNRGAIPCAILAPTGAIRTVAGTINRNPARLT